MSDRSGLRSRGIDRQVATIEEEIRRLRKSVRASATKIAVASSVASFRIANDGADLPEERALSIRPFHLLATDNSGASRTDLRGIPFTLAPSVASMARRIKGDACFDTVALQGYVLVGDPSAVTAYDRFLDPAAAFLDGSVTEEGAYTWVDTRNAGSTDRSVIEHVEGTDNGRVTSSPDGAGSAESYVELGVATAHEADMQVNITAGTATKAAIGLRLAVSGANLTGYFATLDKAAGTFTLREGDPFTGTVLATFTTAATDVHLRLKVTAANVITGYLDDVLSWTYTDATPQTGTKAGFALLSSATGQAYLDNFAAIAPGSMAWRASSPGTSIQDGGTLVTSRPALNFLHPHLQALDDAGGLRTNVRCHPATVAAGTPAFAGRREGDLHWSAASGSCSGCLYVLTGVGGAEATDTFTSPDGTIISGRTTESGGLVWVDTAAAGVDHAEVLSSAASSADQSAGNTDIGINLVVGGAQEVEFYLQPCALSRASVGLRSASDGQTGYYAALNRITGRIGLYEHAAQDPQSGAGTLLVDAATAAIAGLVRVSITAGDLISVYLDGVLVLGPYDDSASPKTGTYVWGHCHNRNTAGGISYLDTFSALSAGTLVWCRVACGADLDGGSSYNTIQEDGGALTKRRKLNFIGEHSTASDDSAGARTQMRVRPATISAGLPGFSNRRAGDEHYNTTDGVLYVLTGAVGTEATDSFTRADQLLAGNVTETGNLTWERKSTASISEPLKITNGSIIVDQSSGRGGYDLDLGVAGVQQVEADISLPAAPGAGVNAALALRVTAVNSQNGYWLRLEYTNNEPASINVYLIKDTMNAGGAGDLGSAVVRGPLNNTPFTGRVLLTITAGHIINVYVDGVLFIGPIDESASPRTGTRATASPAVVGSYKSTIDNFAALAGGTLVWNPVSGGGGTVAYHTVKDEGTARPQRRNVNFIGDAVSAVDNAGTATTDVTVATDGASGTGTARTLGTGATQAAAGNHTHTGVAGHTIQDEGTSLTARTKLNFIGSGVTATDNAGADSTDVTIPRNKVATIRRTSGDLTVNGTNWANLDTGLDLSVAAVVGDIVEVGACGFWNSEAVIGLLDAVSLNATPAPVNSWGLDAAVTTAPSGAGGILAWYGPSGVVTPFGGGMRKVLVAGDIVSGMLTVRLRVATNTATNKLFIAGSGNAFEWFIKNHGQP